MASKINYTHGDAGSQPPDGNDFVQNERPQADYFDWYINTLIVEHNNVVDEFNSHSTRHGYGGSDELATALKYEPESEPSTPTDGVVRWYDSTEDAFKAKFSDGSSVTIAEL